MDGDSEKEERRKMQLRSSTYESKRGLWLTITRGFRSSWPLGHLHKGRRWNKGNQSSDERGRKRSKEEGGG